MTESALREASWTGSESQRRPQGGVARVAPSPYRYRLRCSSPCWVCKPGSRRWVEYITHRTTSFTEAETDTGDTFHVFSKDGLATATRCCRLPGTRKAARTPGSARSANCRFWTPGYLFPEFTQRTQSTQEDPDNLGQV